MHKILRVIPEKGLENWQKITDFSVIWNCFAIKKILYIHLFSIRTDKSSSLLTIFLICEKFAKNDKFWPKGRVKPKFHRSRQFIPVKPRFDFWPVMFKLLGRVYALWHNFSLYRFLWWFYDFEPDDSSRNDSRHTSFIRISKIRSRLACFQDFTKLRPWYSLFCSEFLLIFSYFQIGIAPSLTLFF